MAANTKVFAKKMSLDDILALYADYQKRSEKKDKTTEKGFLNAEIKPKKNQVSANAYDYFVVTVSSKEGYIPFPYILIEDVFVLHYGAFKPEKFLKPGETPKNVIMPVKRLTTNYLENSNYFPSKASLNNCRNEDERKTLFDKKAIERQSYINNTNKLINVLDILDKEFTILHDKIATKDLIKDLSKDAIKKIKNNVYSFKSEIKNQMKKDEEKGEPPKYKYYIKIPVFTRGDESTKKYVGRFGYVNQKKEFLEKVFDSRESKKEKKSIPAKAIDNNRKRKILTWNNVDSFITPKSLCTKAILHPEVNYSNQGFSIAIKAVELFISRHKPIDNKADGKHLNNYNDDDMNNDDDENNPDIPSEDEEKKPKAKANRPSSAKAKKVIIKDDDDDDDDDDNNNDNDDKNEITEKSIKNAKKETKSKAKAKKDTIKKKAKKESSDEEDNNKEEDNEDDIDGEIEN
jgi:hypothetical protein